jgi:hypothetical protein
VQREGRGRALEVLGYRVAVTVSPYGLRIESIDEGSS